jgi:hypothetical protein
MEQAEVRVAIDVGCRQHRVAIGDAAGQVCEEFDLQHTRAGFAQFFTRVEPSRFVPDRRRPL